MKRGSFSASAGEEFFSERFFSGCELAIYPFQLYIISVTVCH